MTVGRRWLLPLLLTLGCSSPPPMPAYDSKQAEATLVAALDAWKEGHAAGLARRNPPIRFEDEDCRHGLALVGYRLASGQEPVRPFEDVKVVLSLRDRRGNTAERTAAYQVVLQPAPAVLRSD